MPSTTPLERHTALLQALFCRWFGFAYMDAPYPHRLIEQVADTCANASVACGGQDARTMRRAEKLLRGLRTRPVSIIERRRASRAIFRILPRIASALPRVFAITVYDHLLGDTIEIKGE